jgi:hypothetical protein
MEAAEARCHIAGAALGTTRLRRALGERSYPIYIGPGLLDELELQQRYSKSAGFR